MKTPNDELLEKANKAGWTIICWKPDPFNVLATHPDHPGQEYDLEMLRKEIGFASSEKEYKMRIEALIRERDAAIAEANRRDQKWMDGINESLGAKLDYGDPTARNCASAALRKWKDTIGEQWLMQLAAISTASIQNTRETAKERITRESPYWSQAYEDTCRAIDREMDQRERVEAAERIIKGQVETINGLVMMQPDHIQTENELADILRCNRGRIALTTSARELVEQWERQKQTILNLQSQRENLTQALDTLKNQDREEPLLYCRCMRHRHVPQLNKFEEFGGECGACIDVLRINAELDLIKADTQIQTFRRLLEDMMSENLASAREAAETGNSEGFWLTPKFRERVERALRMDKIPLPDANTAKSPERERALACASQMHNDLAAIERVLNHDDFRQGDCTMALQIHALVIQHRDFSNRLKVFEVEAVKILSLICPTLLTATPVSSTENQQQIPIANETKNR